MRARRMAADGDPRGIGLKAGGPPGQRSDGTADLRNDHPQPRARHQVKFHDGRNPTASTGAATQVGAAFSRERQ